jgi:hypothetical protein
VIDADLSSAILSALSEKEFPEWHVLGEPSPFFRFYHPYENWDSYGEEPKRFVWAKLSSEYNYEDCI